MFITISLHCFRFFCSTLLAKPWKLVLLAGLRFQWELKALCREKVRIYLWRGKKNSIYTPLPTETLLQRNGIRRLRFVALFCFANISVIQFEIICMREIWPKCRFTCYQLSLLLYIKIIDREEFRECTIISLVCVPPALERKFQNPMIKAKL